MVKKSVSGPRSTVIQLANGTIKVYAGKKISEALETIDSLGLYKGVRMIQLVEAVYQQGHKDGAKAVFDARRQSDALLEKSIPHRPPGRPTKKS